jgi:hypothetical protein
MNPVEVTEGACPIVALDRFIQATRDSGYKGTASAISELVDNSIQAEATVIAIEVAEVTGGDWSESLEISVCDNGIGMDPFTLRQALRFGGTTRFGDRRGLGRYGMGLPNASLSQARRVCVYTWQATGTKVKGKRLPIVFTSYLDVDEIADKGLEEVPRPELAKSVPNACQGPSGTLVIWKRCDRLDNRRVSTIIRKLESELGRRFRHYLWAGLRLTINGHVVCPFDPLYVHPSTTVSGARLFGEEMRYEVCADPTDPTVIGLIRVQFSELPVPEWHGLSNEEKRRRRISKGAGISIVRAGREVDYGWFFMGSKHKENYDDWWRCEVHFDPILDEAFGITHTKQQVRPRAHLLEALTPDLEATARALNARARKAHQAIKQSERFSGAEGIATRLEPMLKPLPKRIGEPAKTLLAELAREQPALKKLRSDHATSRYVIVETSLRETAFYSFGRDRDRLVLVINPDHPFVRDLYRPLAESESPRDQQLRTRLELFLLAAARSEAACVGAAEDLAKFRRDWSDAIATYFNDR